MTLKFRTAGLEVIESGNFLAFGLGESEVLLGSPGGEHLRFVFHFESAEEKESALRYESIDENSLRIRLTNWNNVLGTTVIEPVEVGSMQRRKLFIGFAVSKVGSKGEARNITVTFYAGEAVIDG